jgi:hypothetical protein
MNLTEQFHVSDEYHDACDRLTTLVQKHTYRLLAETRRPEICGSLRSSPSTIRRSRCSGISTGKLLQGLYLTHNLDVRVARIFVYGRLVPHGVTVSKSMPMRITPDPSRTGRDTNSDHARFLDGTRTRPRAEVDRRPPSPSDRSRSVPPMSADQTSDEGGIERGRSP